MAFPFLIQEAVHAC